MRTVNVDEEREKGTVGYIIGGRTWLAPEPNIDTFKAVLQAAPTEVGGDATPEEARNASIRGLDSLFPQLELLLTDKETGQPPTIEQLQPHLSVKRAGAILAEVLGEGPAAARPSGGTAS